MCDLAVHGLQLNTTRSLFNFVNDMFAVRHAPPTDNNWTASTKDKLDQFAFSSRK